MKNQKLNPVLEKRFASPLYRKSVKRMTQLVVGLTGKKLNKQQRDAVKFFLEPYTYEDLRNKPALVEEVSADNSAPKNSIKY